MSITYEHKVAFLNTIKDEIFLIDEVLIPLFSNNKNFEKVIKTHGPDEKGKDIVLISKDEFGEYNYTGIIVKNEPITNASIKQKGKEIVSTVSNQITMSIDSGYDSIEEKKKVYFNKILILTSKNISNSAREAFIQIAASHRFTNLKFWESKELIDNIDNYLPEIYLVSHGALSKYFHLLKGKCENMNELKKISIYKGEDKKLSDIYIEPNIIKKDESVNKGHTTTDLTRTTLGALINKKENYLISGAAGAGKSTLLRSEIYRMIIKYESKKDGRIPIFIRIKDVVRNIFSQCNYKLSLIDYLSNEYNLTIDDVNSILEPKNRITFFADGFDELSTDEEINNFLCILKVLEDYPNSNIIITSREIKLIDDKFSSYSRWELSNFSIKQITIFIQKWFKEKNEQLINDLKDHNLLDRLPKTPLVMTLIAILFESDENVEIPSNLSELYKMFVELLLGKWNLDRRIDSFYKANDKETFLTELALFLHYNNKISCTEKELIDLFNITALKLGRSFDNYLLLDELIKDTNLILRNEKNEYEFRHLSFQEYFVGTYLTIKNDVEKIVDVFPHLWWNQVLYFYCGTRKINDDILPKIFDKILISTDKNKILGLFEFGYLIQSSYKTDAKVRGELIFKSMMAYSNTIPKFIAELPEELKNKPEIIFYLSFMEAFKMHFGSKYLKEIYLTIYNEIKKLNFDTFEKALALFLLAAIIANDGNIEVLADCDCIFKDYPELLLMEDFLLRCELLNEVKDKKLKESIKERSKKISKRIKNNKEYFKELLE